jgi:hypothetical protein
LEVKMRVVGRNAALMALVSYSLAGAAVAQTSPSQANPPAARGNDKVCETITVTGSRIGAKRFCGTRAEWEERRRRDREAVEAAQRSPCVVNGTTCK